MRVLLISGLGPTIKHQDLLAGSAFTTEPDTRTAAGRLAGTLSRLSVHDPKHTYPLLRPYHPTAPSRAPVAVPPGPRTRTFPHLTTLTLQAILADADIDLVTHDAEAIWAGEGRTPPGEFDLVLLSTTFIWETGSLTRAIDWIRQRYPTATLILGGQYSNLKHRHILARNTMVDFIIRGDAEIALPQLINAIQGRGNVAEVPNLSWRDHDTGTIHNTDLSYIDLDAMPSPTVNGPAAVVPYESMRGCPFACRFCSFPAASPRWRYKSATKIAADFARYRHDNGTQYIKALDSTFTIPPRRLRQLLPLLATTGVRWEGYTRANAIRDHATVHALEDSHCAALAIGFESMSDTVLGYMNKNVTAAANRTAHQLLARSGIEHRASFMVGYPGETPEHFHDTRQYLVTEYTGRFSLYVFSLTDETMPVWQDAQRFRLHVGNPDRPDTSWRHIGMDSHTAQALQRETLTDIRWHNDDAVLNLWQGRYEMPLAPTRSDTENLRIEKFIERLAMLPVDFPEPEAQSRRSANMVSQLSQHGIFCRA
ncbi:B12-binding domain-containing radical SAM protein [Nocardia sp. N2S4-5]|uniref:B12-binding domain-containing radical SAM protein n=1 Tax=Nocardia sp. N2S4-5 TaxID=3351565 RepID=UPI0037D64168